MAEPIYYQHSKCDGKGCELCDFEGKVLAKFYTCPTCARAWTIYDMQELKPIFEQDGKTVCIGCSKKREVKYINDFQIALDRLKTGESISLMTDCDGKLAHLYFVEPDKTPIYLRKNIRDKIIMEVGMRWVWMSGNEYKACFKEGCDGMPCIHFDEIS